MTEAYMYDDVIFCGLGCSKKEIEKNIVDFLRKPNGSLPATLIETKTKKPNRSSTVERKENRSARLFGDFVSALELKYTDNLSVHPNTPLIFASTCFDLPLHEHNFEQEPIDKDKLTPLNTLPDIIIQRLSLKGPLFTLNTACTSSANALLLAKDLIRSSEFEQVLVVSFELFNRLNTYGFGSLQLLAENYQMPYSGMDGMVLGECMCSVMVGTNRKGSMQLLGGCNTTGTESITSTDKSGESYKTCMNKSLSSIDLDKNQIKYIKLHAVGTINSDTAELSAILKMGFNKNTDYYALKPYIGHTLSACGLVEILLTAISIDQKIPVPHFSLVKGNFINNKSLVVESGDILLFNQFAFGGNNNTLILSKT